MTKAVILDAGPLARISHPRPNPDVYTWLERLLVSGASVLIPEIADYEVRRELLRAGRTKGVARLDELKRLLIYVPLDTETMLRAAELWAEARRRGQPTADPRELDADVILAAQAERAAAVVATENVGHLSRFVEARNWKEI